MRLKYYRFSIFLKKAIPLNGWIQNILIFGEKSFCLTGKIEVIWFLVRKAIPLNGWNQNIFIFCEMLLCFMGEIYSLKAI